MQHLELDQDKLKHVEVTQTNHVGLTKTKVHLHLDLHWTDWLQYLCQCRRDKQLVFTTIFQTTLVQLPVLDFTGAAVAAEARSPSINMPMTFPTAGRSN